jgi:glycerol-3-phosphate dehydrogenase
MSHSDRNDIPPKPRQFEELNRQRFDVLIIGGGITGAGIARDLSLRGAKVALVDRDDFASGTSSCSTKLVHGGLRYLEQMDFGLVFESCRERYILQKIAPHLVRPLPLMIPLYHGARRSSGMVRAGLMLYDLLALFRNTHHHQMLDAASALSHQPRLATEGLKGAALYWDCRMDDARLCLENLLDARENGAVTVNHAEVIDILQSNGRASGATIQDRESGTTCDVDAEVVVNAGGPWLDQICAMTGDRSTKLRPSRGSHILVPRLSAAEEALYLSADQDDRLFFAVPWGELSLIGTTDIDENSSPETVQPSTEEIDYLLQATADYLPGTRLKRSDVVASFCGVRPLLAGETDHPSGASREHRIFEAANGLLSVGGGKYTTYRSMAAEAADRVMDALGRPSGKASTDRRQLPGGTTGSFSRYVEQMTPQLAKESALPPAELRRLLDRYGARTRHLLSLLQQEPALANQVCPDSPLLGLEVAYAADFEMARTPTDVLRRRTGLALTSGRGLSELDAVSRLLEKRLGLGAELVKQGESTYYDEVAVHTPEE